MGLQDECQICHTITWLGFVRDKYACCESCYYRIEKPEKIVTRICARCFETRNLKKTCSNCSSVIEEYANNSLLCEDCKNLEVFRPASTKVQKCLECGILSHLNNEGLCMNCFNRYNVQPPKRCKSCGKPVIRGAAYCDECVSLASRRTQRVCHGCGQTLSTASQYDSFCHKCKINLERGVCTNCSENTLVADNHGWCTKCQVDNG